jgi:hypothetical protein
MGRATQGAWTNPGEDNLSILCYTEERNTSFQPHEADKTTYTQDNMKVVCQEDRLDMAGIV